MTTRYFLYCCFILLLCCSPVFVFAEGMPIRIRMNVAHRGASVKKPENTIPSFVQAILDGADGAECDVRRSADGVLVLCHDVSPQRTLAGTAKDEKIPSLSYDEIRKRDYGAWKGEQFKGIRMPTLDEYLQVLKGAPCHPVIEIKETGKSEESIITQEVIDAVKKADMMDVALIISWSEHVVKEVRRIEPKMPVAWLAWYRDEARQRDEYGTSLSTDQWAAFLIGKSKELDTRMLDVGESSVTEPLIKALQKEGIHVLTFTVDDPERMKQLLDWGIESITTNKPDVLTEILKKRNK